MMAELATAAALTLGTISCPHYCHVPKELKANLAFRRDVINMASRDKQTALAIRQMCAEDLLFYVNTFCWTYDPRSKASVIPFITYTEFQDAAMLGIADCVEIGEDFAMPKSRDMGASWMGLTAFEWFWHFRPNLSFLLVSRNEDYVDKRGNPKSLFWKIDFLHEHQPRWLLPTDRWLGYRDPSRKLLHLGNVDNGSIIDGESTTGDAGRGDRRTAMFIDEHAAFDLNDGFRVLRATRDTTNCRGFNSTPQGSNNGFYEVVHSTNARIIRLHWSDHPIKSLGSYSTKTRDGKVELLDGFRGIVEVRRKGETQRRSVMFPDDYPFILDGKLRSPWYDGECARCVNPMEVAQELDIDFLGSDYQFFDPDFIDILRKKYCRAPLVLGTLEFNPETLQPKRFVESPNGNLLLWLQLDAKGHVPKDVPYVLGSDISAGTGASNSVSCVVDRRTGEKVGCLRTPHLRPNPFAGLSLALGHFFNDAYMIWDATGPTGKIYTQRVIQHGYGNIYFRRNEKLASRAASKEPGYYLQPTAREALLEDYRAALADHSFINRSDQGMSECLQFIRKSDGTIAHSAQANAQDPSGARTAHGDEVIADALTCVGLSETRQKAKTEKPKAPMGSLAWRREQQAAKAAKGDIDGFGGGWGEC